MSFVSHWMVAISAVALTAQAEPSSPEAPQALDRVEVVTQRSTVMPYARWVSAVQPVHRISGGQLRQGVRLFSRDKSRALRVSVDDDAHSQAISPLLGELYVVPHDLPMEGAQAELSVNRSDGSWGVGNFALVPQLGPQPPDVAAVRQVLGGYRAVYRERFPLSWRLLSRSEASLDVCLPQAGGLLRVVATDGRALIELPMMRTPQEHAQTTGLSLHCASLKPEPGWDGQARLEYPDQAVVLLGFRLL